MEKLVEIIVDGKNLNVPANTNILQSLLDNGIEIPALCYHPSLESSGSCGLCMVEVLNADRWEPRHACLLQTEDGLKIKTDTERLKNMRSWAARILLRRRPFANPEIEEYLLKLVVDETRSKQENENLAKSIRDLSGSLMKGCILCGRCVRICSKIRNRLTFLGRGKFLRIGFVFGDDEQTSCGNCHACKMICPTGFITPDAERAFKARLYYE